MHVPKVIAASLLSLALGKTTMPPPQVLLIPAYPPPVKLNVASNFQSATAELSSSLGTALSHGLSPFGNFTPKATSVSVSLKSTAQQSTLFDFQFTGSGLNVSAGSTSQVSGDSVFRIGSISKLFTVYALLLHNGLDLWERPVTEYVPELRDYARRAEYSSQVDHVSWEDVTLGALASQISGIGSNYNEGDLSTFPFPWIEYGLPKLDPAYIPSCGAISTQPPCSRAEYLEGFVKRHPVFPTQFTPIYSNAAFHILGYALEGIVGDSFENIMKRDIFEPLGLGNSSVSKPESGSGVIPSGETHWETDIGDDTPSGGLYSTANDLVDLARNILLSAQLSPTVTRRWLKPLAHTSALTFSIGAPWEIYRTKSNITTGRTVDIYTKSGGVGSYASLIILIPDYEVAVAILTAGPNGNVVNYIAEMIMQMLIPQLEKSARVEASDSLTGWYISETGENSSISIMEDNGPGLVIVSWISKGSNLLWVADEYLDTSNSGHVRSLRLYPTALKDRMCYGSRAAYRAVFDIWTETGPEGAIFNENTNPWASVDEAMYGNVAVDEFIFEFDFLGAASYVESCVLGSRLIRVRN